MSHDPRSSLSSLIYQQRYSSPTLGRQDFGRLSNRIMRRNGDTLRNQYKHLRHFINNREERETIVESTETDEKPRAARNLQRTSALHQSLFTTSQSVIRTPTKTTKQYDYPKKEYRAQPTVDPVDVARLQVKNGEYTLTHENLKYQFHWKIFFLKLGTVHDNMAMAIHKAARRLDCAYHGQAGPAKRMEHWFELMVYPSDEVVSELKETMKWLLKSLFVGAGLAYLDGPKCLAMERGYRERLRDALQESLDETWSHLFSLGMDIVDRKQPEGWSIERLLADSTVHTTWVEELGIDSYQMAS